ncbi:Pachytene checkpoint protein 2 homolog [Aduncisulcus paluster]|uniref:Pachytene checkpoint protein 2 homolog n=1 Tax=Aduncisulcus paluster TaxID=2918883 RepID=A0ABQ5JXL9_9EUKA|nr:Pachytene checkpoint protein 2 homolog [Aduncisulcus paluster]
MIKSIVEVCIKRKHDDIIERVHDFITINHPFISPGTISFSSDAFLTEYVHKITIDIPSQYSDSKIPLSTLNLEIMTYLLVDADVEDCVIAEESDEVTAFHSWSLPCRQLEGMWESLILPPSIKPLLLSYSQASLFLSEKKVDTSLVSCNRLILLHGVPGTGKTTLCKGLAQKLAIRMSKQFSDAQLVVVNAHSLFSKWFSESGKLVSKMFEQIREMCEDGIFVCVLVDEVESLSASRTAALAGSEPSDAIRVVNAVLTELDKLSKFSNCLILATSNITKAVDEAFLDRADLTITLPRPGSEARQQIIQGCLDELRSRGIFSDFLSPHMGSSGIDSSSASPHAMKRRSITSQLSHEAHRVLDILQKYPEIQLSKDRRLHLEHKAEESTMDVFMAEVVDVTEGLSGRFLRKLPLMTLSKIMAHTGQTTVPEEVFILFMIICAEDRVKEKH